MSLASLKPEPSNISYERHRPEQTLLYKLVQENLLSFYAQVEREHGSGLPDFVRKEFEEFLKCGVLAHGFLRAKCDSCAHEKLVAFSCKRRGFCPSCGVRRMVESAAHLVDEVFPKKPLRQWVVTFPFQVRFLLAQDAKLMSAVLRVVNRAIESHLLNKAGAKRKDGAKTGAVTFVQRFGSSLNLNIHFHIMYLDGVYRFKEDQAVFQVTKAPTSKELEKLLSNITKRVVRLLERRGLIKEDLTPKEQSGFSHIQASSITYRIALGKYKGQKALSLQTLPERERTENKYLAKNSGFSLHAGIACGAHERKKLERICRYIARASLSEERLSTNKKGQVIYKLKKAYDNGTTQIVLEPLDFLSRLASLVPKPRVNLTRFHGVFAPNFKHRAKVVPMLKEAPKAEEKDKAKNKAYAMTWSQRLKRVFKIDIEKCPSCETGKLKVISSIEEPSVIKQILEHIGVDASILSPHAARAPPDEEDFHLEMYEEN